MIVSETDCSMFNAEDRVVKTIGKLPKIESVDSVARRMSHFVAFIISYSIQHSFLLLSICKVVGGH